MSTDFNFSVNLPLVVRGAVSAKRIRFPPFNPCVRFSRTRLTDELLDMVTQRQKRTPALSDYGKSATGIHTRMEVV